MTGRLPLSLLPAALVLGSSPSLFAASLIIPFGIDLVGADQFFAADHLIDGSGLEFQLSDGAALPTDWNHRWGSPGSDSWLSGAPGGFPSDWYANSATVPTFVMDLGQDTSLDAAHLWAFSGISGVSDTIQGNSARGLEFRFNTAAQGNETFAGPAVSATLDHGPVSQTSPGYILPRQDVSLGQQTARWVQMSITDNWYVAPGNGSTQDEHGHLIRGGDRVGLGEIRFSVSAIPEPEAFACVAGLGLVMFTVWRRWTR